jgi:hypothetical protein
MQENYISKMAEGKIVELSSTIIPLSLQVRNKNYKCLIRGDKLPILKLLAHTICKVYHHHVLFFHRSDWQAYGEYIIIRLFGLTPYNSSLSSYRPNIKSFPSIQENFDRKLILTDRRSVYDNTSFRACKNDSYVYIQ